MKNKVPKRTALSAVFIIICIPAVIVADVLLFHDRSYYAASLIIIALAMLPFALVFEGRKPQARELVVIAVMVAIAVAGRAAFFMVPQFKPVVALVIIAGAALGAESGFIVGALSGFVSNFIFGQGPWTPWQMFAFGMIGFIAGLLFYKLAASIGAPSRGGLPPRSAAGSGKWYDTGRLGWNVRARKRVEWLRVFALCVFGGGITFVLYGILLDTAATVMFSQGGFSMSALLATYISGIPLNMIHAVSTIIFLLILARPMIEKLERVKKKYGLLGAEA
ncbi:MAG: ECF transporter S component [Clostridiales Family XIII bacterium]|jgi:energy-coupling factor transport system substrate-specific component|nr:ECF transporter S component [Clostridiales Family XIII bacterium]